MVVDDASGPWRRRRRARSIGAGRSQMRRSTRPAPITTIALIRRNRSGHERTGLRATCARAFARAMTGHCKGSGLGNRAVVRPHCLSCVVVVAPWPREAPDPPAPFATEDPSVMIKRILLAIALAVSLGGAVVACNTPASTTSPSQPSGALIARGLFHVVKSHVG